MSHSYRRLTARRYPTFLGAALCGGEITFDLEKGVCHEETVSDRCNPTRAGN